MNRKSQLTFCTVCATITLALTFLAIGFAVCAGIPWVTQALSENTSNDADSPFSREQLTEAAMATRSYTIETNDEEALMAVIADINAQAMTPYAHSSAEELAAAPESYTLTPEALSHLDDVYDVVNRMFFPLMGIAALAALFLVYLVRTYGLRSIKKSLIGGGACALAVLAFLALAAFIDFEGFFATFHSLFFAEGTWVFSYDSLLICMYPEAFWMGMGGIWLAVSVVLSILSLTFGISMTAPVPETKPNIDTAGQPNR